VRSEIYLKKRDELISKRAMFTQDRKRRIAQLIYGMKLFTQMNGERKRREASKFNPLPNK
jgi:hypothetical protein